ncbi:S24 family peptidase [Sphingomonas immobilis]|uniref:S24 family peptidase n=1 Tax=Sphingomonas immobilis TaxID=3063997 RepID=A0ABT9A0J4_9SPHN|nr:S24 family peptidase [Sphingomonas sp. CA1-15]MDO7843353.1 S24 family peptidase [Sphingomonas sp. CA1-15]
MDQARETLATLIAESGQSYGALSRMLRRNEAYLQQYVRRGTPRILAERDRRLLAAFFRVEESVLGGPPSSAPARIAVRRLDIHASAGPGALADDDLRTGSAHFDAGLLARLGVQPGAAAEIRASGESMAPLIQDGDLMLVDERDRRVGTASGVYVLRLDGALMVKRLSRDGPLIRIQSDNPAAPPIAPRDLREMEVIGRVVWLSRSLR